MAVGISYATAQDACDAIADGFDDGSAGAGEVKVFTGAQPASTDAADSGTELISWSLANPSFGSAVDANPGATADIVGAVDGTAGASGTAGHFRVYDRDGNARLQGDCGALGSGAEMELKDTSITSGARITLTLFTLQVPES